MSRGDSAAVLPNEYHVAMDLDAMAETVTTIRRRRWQRRTQSLLPDPHGTVPGVDVGFAGRPFVFTDDGSDPVRCHGDDIAGVWREKDLVCAPRLGRRNCLRRVAGREQPDHERQRRNGLPTPDHVRFLHRAHTCRVRDAAGRQSQPHGSPALKLQDGLSEPRPSRLSGSARPQRSMPRPTM